MTPWKSYKERIRILSERIVAAQAEIRILDAVKWDGAIRERFFENGFKELPAVDAAYYEAMPLGFDPREKRDLFEGIVTDIKSSLDSTDELRGLLTEVAQQYLDVIELLSTRGTSRFGELCLKLYGSPRDQFDEKVTVIELGKMLYSILHKTPPLGHREQFEMTISDERAVSILGERMQKYFGSEEVVVQISDGIVADASAGGNLVKIRKGARFSKRMIDILEVHEGWVHVGTTRNGLKQTAAKFLAKGPPRASMTQEGLAQMMEIFTFRSYPDRAKRVNDRILSIDKAIEGADFLQVFDYFRTEGYSEEESYRNSYRVFRGGVVRGGAPFTKDIVYCKGFVQIYNFLRSAIAANKFEILPFLFVGKVNLDDIPILYRKYKEGIVDPPCYVPEIFSDLNGLAVWMGYSNFFNMINLKKVRARYDAMFVGL